MIAWLAETWIATTALMGLVLALRGTVARHFGPRAAYALWALPALRMVLPPLPTGILSFGADGAAATSAATTEPSQWLMITAAVMFAGALSFFAWHARSYACYSKRLRASASPIGADGAIEIGQTELTPSPVAFGIIGKSVMLPGDFEARYDPAEQRLALAHELTHHRRGDLIANVAALGILSLHWFNPIAHIAFRAFRQDQEAACDAAVLHEASDADRHAYGSALVKSALGAAPMVACRISGVQGVKARLAHIVSARETAAFHDHGLALAGVVVLAGLGLSASAMAPAEKAAPNMTPAPHFAIVNHPVEKTPQLAAAIPSQPDAPIVVTGAKASAPAPQPPTLAKAETAKPVAPALADTPRQPAPALAPTLAANGPCGEGGVAVGTGQQIIYNDGMAQSANFVICARPTVNASYQQQRDAAEQQRTALLRQRISAIGQLQRARFSIANDGSIPIDQRMAMIEAIDTKLEEIANTQV